MAKFNTKKLQTEKVQRKMVDNKAGGKAWKTDEAAELAGLAFTSFLKPKFYMSDNQVMSRIYQLMDKLPPKFSAQVAWKTRHIFGLRTVSHVMTAYLAKSGLTSGQSWASKFYESMIVRPDDIQEIMALLETKVKNEKGNNMKIKISHAMRKGFARAMKNFSEYQLAKYAKFSSGRGINLNDVVRYCHVPFDKEAEPEFEKLMRRTLKNTDTWESMGNSVETWLTLFKEEKYSYMSVLKNVRNIAKHNNQELTDLAVDVITKESNIKNSRTFPFEYLKAYHALTEYASSVGNFQVTKLKKALSKACDISLSNIPRLKGNTVIFLDQSGSMGNIRKESNLFAIALANACDSAICMAFSSSASYLTKINGNNNIIDTADNLSFMGGGTNFHAAFELAKKDKMVVDRVILITDEQSWMSSPDGYSSSYTYKTPYDTFLNWCNSVQMPHPEVWSIDMASYGTTQFPKDKVRVLYGFSEKIFDLMPEMEGDVEAFVKSINDVEFRTNKEIKAARKVSYQFESETDEDADEVVED